MRSLLKKEGGLKKKKNKSWPARGENNTSVFVLFFPRGFFRLQPQNRCCRGQLGFFWGFPLWVGLGDGTNEVATLHYLKPRPPLAPTPVATQPRCVTAKRSLASGAFTPEASFRKQWGVLSLIPRGWTVICPATGTKQPRRVQHSAVAPVLFTGNFSVKWNCFGAERDRCDSTP